jgi:hypothetical protein
MSTAGNLITPTGQRYYPLRASMVLPLEFIPFAAPRPADSAAPAGIERVDGDLGANGRVNQIRRFIPTGCAQSRMTDLIVVPQTNQWQRLKALALDSVISPITKRVYNLGLDEFFAWYELEPRNR